MSNYTFINEDKSKLIPLLPELFDILYANMSKLAPTGESYEDDRKMWLESIAPALEKPQRSIILIYHGQDIIGFFMYTVNNGCFYMEEIQLKAEYHGKGIFNELYRYLLDTLPCDIDHVEAYSNKHNVKSQGILSHLGLKCVGENKNGHSYHYHGSYRDLRKATEHTQRSDMKMNPPSLCYCGHDCSRCVTYTATVKNDDELRAKAQSFYAETFGIELPIEKFNCNGGRCESVFELCRDCPFKKCCAQHKVNTCNECSEYPCNTIAEYEARYVNKCNQL